MCFHGGANGQPTYDCDNALINYCKAEANQGKDICQCFLPSSVYEKYYSSILPGVPASVISQLNTQPTCNYPTCSTQPYQPKERPECPAQCIMYANVDNQGKIISGGDLINQNCSLNCSDTTSCSIGKCYSGVCVTPPTNGGGTTPTSWIQKNLIFIVIVIIAVILLLLLIFLVV